MKRILSLLLLSAGITGTAMAQSSYNPNSNSVGIGTTSPTSASGYGNATLNGTTGGYIDFWTGNNNKRAAITGDVSGLSLYSYNNQPVRLVINNQPLFTLYGDGALGLGTATPQSTFHMSSAASARHATNQYSGNLIIQGNSGGRSTTQGASLEFAIPANTDGYNPWGQARIITVAGNTDNASAAGKLILGTRRMFDKGVGTGTNWNYGDDLVIDGTGNVGVGTSSPDQKLTVNGTIHATKVLVEATVPTPDYVFEKGYKLRSLKEVEAYIKANKHLPEVASAKEMQTKGIDMTELNMKLLQKIEEMTLYMLEREKKEKHQDRRIKQLENQLKAAATNHR